MIRREKYFYLALVVLSFGALFCFLAWWARPSHIPHNFTGPKHGFDILLFVLLTAVFAHRLFMDAFSWVAAWGMRRLSTAGPPPVGLRVAFITTFVPSSEPIDLLLDTLPAMRDADYPHDTWVLDEGGDEQVRKVCASLGVKYFSRHGVRKYNLVAGPFTRRTKGGNHNAWYNEFADDYDIVAQIDTDFVPRSDFLLATLGYFEDPEVGFVGTPQVYGNLEQSFVARGAAQQLYMFYGPIMRGLAGRGSANMIGANHVVRVEALRGIGFYAGHLTEDLLTGMRLHAAGWKSRYVATPLAIGEGPATWRAYFDQQMRWAFGCMDILRRHSLQLTSTMGRRQRLLYLALQQHYFSGIAAAMGAVLLCGYFFGGLSPADVSLRSTLTWIAALVILRQVVTLWLQRFSPDPRTDRGMLLSGRYVSIVSWPVYFLAAVGVARQKRLVFKVTPKGPNQAEIEPWSICWPHLAAAGLSTVCLVVGVICHRMAPAMVFWAVANAVLMLSFVGVVSMSNFVAWIRARTGSRGDWWGIAHRRSGLTQVIDNSTTSRAA